MKATESQETHAVCHATFLYETTGIQWYLRHILRPLHLLDGFFKSENLSLLNSLLVCVQEGWGLFRYSGFSDLCNTGQKVGKWSLCFFWLLVADYQASLTNLCCLYSHANCPQIGLILSTLAACIAKVTKTTVYNPPQIYHADKRYSLFPSVQLQERNRCNKSFLYSFTIISNLTWHHIIP